MRHELRWGVRAVHSSRPLLGTEGQTGVPKHASKALCQQAIGVTLPHVQWPAHGVRGFNGQHGLAP